MQKTSSARQFAIIGGGSIGMRHAHNLRHLGYNDLLIIEPASPRSAQLRTAGFAVSDRLGDAFAPAVDAVLICSPTIHHHAHLEAAIQARKAIFIEKPISHQLTGVAALVEEAADLVTLVGFNMRFRDGYKRAKALLDAGRIGKPLAARANISYYLPHYHPDKDYRTRYQAQKALGGGVVLDDIHELDYLADLFGKPREVFAFVEKLSDLEIDVEDYAGVMMKHTNGVLTQLQLDFLRRVYSRTLEITGSEATLTLDHNTGEIRLYGPHDHQYEVLTQNMGVTVNDMYLAEMRHFIACLAGEETPLADLRVGYEALRLAMAIFESAHKKELVRL